MQKRYQVFVSSTFWDLEDERREIMHALLELRCFPAGMELFPASNETAWNLIKRVIDDSDYYVVVVAGRYGSVDPTSKISYTEMEFDYAVASGKPVLAFLHSKPAEIPTGKTEGTDSGKEMLARFRKKIEATVHAKYWSDAGDLGSKVSRSVATIKEDRPAEGWVRGRNALTDEQAKEMMNLQIRNRELEAQLEASQKPVTLVQIASEFDEMTVDLLKRLIHPHAESFVQTAKDGSMFQIQFYSGASDQPFVNLKTRGGRIEYAAARHAVSDLKRVGFIEAFVGSNKLRPTYLAFQCGLDPMAPQTATSFFIAE